MVLYICVRFHENISNGFQRTDQTQVHGRNGYVQCSKGNNSKSRQTKVMVHVFCMSSHGALNLCEVSSILCMEWTRVHVRNAMFNVQRVITP